MDDSAFRPVLQVSKLEKKFHLASEEVCALRGVSMRIEPGEFVAVMGPSGSGKSTLLHLIGGLDEPTGGSIIIEGQELGLMTDHERTVFRRRRLGIIFQSYNLLPTLTALENVALPAMIDGAESNASARRACELLDWVDLGHRAHHRPQAMSGGEQQRVAIARALMKDPVLILADEPTGNLDTQHSEAIWGLLSRLVRESRRFGQSTRTVVAVTHEAAATAYVSRAITLCDGRITSDERLNGELREVPLAAGAS